MRVLHTSDWHVGVLLGGRDRTQEHAVFLEELETVVREEKVEAVLVSGDIFDHPNPTADAEKLVFEFFRKMAERRVSVVFIAGNHDSGARIEGKARLLELVNIHAFGKPQRGAAIELHGERDRLVVAALPFAGELRLLDWEDTAKQEGEQRTVFAERMQNLLSILVRSHFKPDSVNILMAHLTVDGAVLSGSEKNIRMSDAWTIPSTMLPSSGHYVALGHIHRAQEIADSPVRAAYSGSPLHIDFGEEKDQKGVYLLEAEPKKPVTMRFRPLGRVKPIKALHLALRDLERASDEHRNFPGHLKVVVKLEEDDRRARVAEEVRKLLPQTLIVQVEAPKPSRHLPEIQGAFVLNPLEAYKLYLESQNRQPSPDLLEKLQELIEAVHASASP